MKLGRVLGSVVATRKTPALKGLPLRVIEPLNDQREVTGDPLVAIDHYGAANEEIIFYVRGREATLCLPDHFVPVDATILGNVDDVDRG